MVVKNNLSTDKLPIKIPKIVGILNLTPDSFSDGGKYFSCEDALLQLDKMLNEGADIIDIGAESTRPNAQILDASTEISRLKDILPKVSSHIKNFNSKNNKQVKLSIDSYHFETIVFACDCGVEIINDVSGLIDNRIIDFIARNKLKTILMHNLAIHANPNIIINRELNVFKEIYNWALRKIAFLEQRKVDKSQLIFDPGIGFGKDAKQSINILKNIEAYKNLGLEIFIGHSKKSFLDAIRIDGKNDDKIGGKISSSTQLNRAQKTLIISHYLAQKNIDYIRVHDVKENIEAITKSIYNYERHLA